jgi:hypothetical protein
MDDRDRLPYRTPWVPWALTSVALVGVALVAYTLGAERHVVVDGEPVHRVWVHGGFPGFWLFILFFWIVVFGGLRRMWWGWGYPYYPWRYRRYYRHPDDYEDERDAWEEWHRRAHGRMTPQGGGDTAPAPPHRDTMA